MNILCTQFRGMQSNIWYYFNSMDLHVATCCAQLAKVDVKKEDWLLALYSPNRDHPGWLRNFDPYPPAAITSMFRISDECNWIENKLYITGKGTCICVLGNRTNASTIEDLLYAMWNLKIFLKLHVEPLGKCNLKEFSNITSIILDTLLRLSYKFLTQKITNMCTFFVL